MKTTERHTMPPADRVEILSVSISLTSRSFSNRYLAPKTRWRTVR
jgi:hypothetical protein